MEKTKGKNKTVKVEEVAKAVMYALKESLVISCKQSCEGVLEIKLMNQQKFFLRIEESV